MPKFRTLTHRTKRDLVLSYCLHPLVVLRELLTYHRTLLQSHHQYYQQNRRNNLLEFHSVLFILFFIAYAVVASSFVRDSPVTVQTLPNRKRNDLSGIREGPHSPYQGYVSHFVIWFSIVRKGPKCFRIISPALTLITRSQHRIRLSRSMIFSPNCKPH